MSTEIKLSGPTLGSNTYAGQGAMPYIAAALLSGKTLDKGLINVISNIAYKQVIRNWQDSVSIDAATCDFTDNSSVTLDEYILTLTEKQVNLELCKDNLWSTWESAQMGASAFKTLPNEFRKFVLAQVSASVAAQVEPGIWSTDMFFSGAGDYDGLGGYLFDNSAIEQAVTSATDNSNVVARLQSLVDGMPDALYMKEGVTLYINNVVAKAYQQAQSALGYKDLYYDEEKPWNFQGIPMEVIPGLSNSNTSGTKSIQAILANKNDLHFGTGLLADRNKVQLIDMSDIDGSQNVRIVMRFTGGVIATNPAQQSVLTVEIA